MKHFALALLLVAAPQDPDITDLLAQLGDDDIAVRDSADAALRRLPADALPVLKAALDRSRGDLRARLEEITELIERADVERRHDAFQRARFLKTDRADEGVTLTCAPRAHGEGIVITTTLANPGIEADWTVAGALSEKGEAVALERCAACSPRLVFAATKQPVRARITGVRRWYSDYDVLFEKPKNGDSRRIGDCTIEVAWPLVVITSRQSMAASVLAKTASMFSFELKYQSDFDVIGVGGGRCGFGRIIRGGKREPAGWCACLNGPAPWKEPVVPMAGRHSVTGFRADQYPIEQIASIRLTFRKPIEEPLEIESAVLKP